MGIVAGAGEGAVSGLVSLVPGNLTSHMSAQGESIDYSLRIPVYCDLFFIPFNNSTLPRRKPGYFLLNGEHLASF